MRELEFPDKIPKKGITIPILNISKKIEIKKKKVKKYNDIIKFLGRIIFNFFIVLIIIFFFFMKFSFLKQLKYNYLKMQD